MMSSKEQGGYKPLTNGHENDLTQEEKAAVYRLLSTHGHRGSDRGNALRHSAMEKLHRELYPED